MKFTFKNIKSSIQGVNKFVLDSTEEIIDNTIEGISKWQGVGEKAIKGGLKIAAKQQDIVFDSLEMAKSQIKKNKARF
jgi:hypothetical protein